MSAINGVNIFSNYAREIEKYWKYKESQRTLFMANSPQLYLRSYLIEWLKGVSGKLEVSYKTVHLAIYFLDTFMDKHYIKIHRLGLVALVCLMLAAKFEEIDSKIPKISELNKYDGFRCSKRDFISLEAMILKFLDFDLTQPTIAHFGEYYAMVAVLPLDLKSSTVSFRRLGEQAHNIITEFIDICLRDEKFLKHPPSKVAAACIFATRRYMNLSPAWTSVLAEVTGYGQESVLVCGGMLMSKVHQEKKHKKKIITSPDQGYVSDVC